ncbi:hypothetical protein ACQEWB_21350 [Streptomyces sp. CA-249302]|uniref:hypothetical protein n=1 Tax=Streptomyces sp. CA-249302 TaxID=3240058 RepID=UPI003D8B8453
MQRTTRTAGVAFTGALVLLGALTGCGTGSREATSLSAPSVFYLRPYGEKSTPEDFLRFAVEVNGGSPYVRNEPRRVTVVVPPGSRDVVRLRESAPDCSGTGTRVTCDIAGDNINGQGQARILPLAVKGGRIGQSGYVDLTYETKGGKKLTARTRVVVGTPVVQAFVPKAFEGVRPGGELRHPLVVRNTGDVPVVGLGLRLQPGEGEFADRSRSCRYPDPKSPLGNAVTCTFPDLRIAPGETVTLRPALRLRAPKTRMYDTVGTEVWALDTDPASDTRARRGDPGDGPALAAVTGTAAGLPAGTFREGGGTTPVSLDLHADYRVTGATLHGNPDDIRKLRLTVRNDGPGNPGAAAELVFEPPLGTGVVKQPTTEIDDGEYGPYCDFNGYSYTCPVRQLAPGRSRTFEFTLRLGDPATGRVLLQDTDQATKYHFGRHDPDNDNDEARIAVER